MKESINQSFYYSCRQWINGKFVLFNGASRAHWFSYHRLLDIKHMAIVTYFFRGNLPSPHRLLFPISSSRGSFICTFPQTQQHNHWWTSCGLLVERENSPNCKWRALFQNALSAIPKKRAYNANAKFDYYVLEKSFLHMNRYIYIYM